MRHNFNEIPTETLALATFRCSACGRQFKLLLGTKTEIECPHCHYQYVCLRGEWQSKQWVEFLVAKQREWLEKNA